MGYLLWLFLIAYRLRLIGWLFVVLVLCLLDIVIGTCDFGVY